MLRQENHAWTIRDLMKVSIDHLQRHGFGESRLNVELLLSHALECQRIELYTHFDKPLKNSELTLFRGLFERRLAHEPVQYIVGATNFMGLQLAVDKRAFIPRPETETLVEQVMMKCREHFEGEGPSILEFGTGSGNIAVSIAKLVKYSRITSVDISLEALEVAKANAATHGVLDAITFHHANVLVPFEPAIAGPYDFLISNPPYVSIQDWQDLEPEVRQFEPRQAVSDQNDGYEFYRRIGELIPSLVRSNGWVVVEAGFGQSETVSEIFRQAGLTDISVVDDLQEIPRVILGKRN